MMEDLEQLAQSLSATNEAALRKVSSLVSQMAVLEQQVENTEQELKRYKESLRQIEEVLLPAALAEAGTSQLTTTDGVQVTVVPFYSASIPKNRTDEAYEWLRQNGHGDLVKNLVSVTFGRQEDDKALELMQGLERRGYSVGQKQWVEPMTLKAFVREQLEGGADIPTDLFGVYAGSKAKITAKKGRL